MNALPLDDSALPDNGMDLLASLLQGWETSGANESLVPENACESAPVSVAVSVAESVAESSPEIVAADAHKESVDAPPSYPIPAAPISDSSISDALTTVNPAPAALSAAAPSSDQDEDDLLSALLLAMPEEEPVAASEPSLIESSTQSSIQNSTQSQPQSLQNLPALAADPISPPEPRRSEEAIRAELRTGLFEMIYNIEQRVISARKSNQFLTANQSKWIHFEVDGDRYAIPISQVSETGHLPPWTPVPGLGGALRGLVNHRGEVLPLADLRYLLGGSGAAYPSAERMLVVRTPNSHGPCVLAVDRIPGLLTLSPGDIKPQPGQYVSGFCEREGDVIRLLDLERLFEHLAQSLAGQASVS